MKNLPNGSKEKQTVLTALNVALGFSTFALLATVFLMPLSSKLGQNVADRIIALKAPAEELDDIKTGSIAAPVTANPKPETRSYTVRRSVMQKSRDNPCIISSDGSRSGDC